MRKGERHDPTKELRNKTISIRLTQTEYDAFHRWCHEQYTTMASVVFKKIQAIMKKEKIGTFKVDESSTPE